MEIDNVKVQTSRNFNFHRFKNSCEELEIVLTYKLSIRDRLKLLFNPYLFFISQTIEQKEAPNLLTLNKLDIQTEISNSLKIGVKVMDY